MALFIQCEGLGCRLRNGYGRWGGLRGGNRSHTATQDAAYPRHQLARRKGFGNVVIGAEFQPYYAVNLVAAGCEKQHGHLRAAG